MRDVPFFLRYTLSTGTANREIANAIDALAAWHEVKLAGAQKIEMRDGVYYVLTLVELAALSRVPVV
jgi:hypothetical protein